MIRFISQSATRQTASSVTKFAYAVKVNSIKIPKMFIPSSHRLRGAPAVSAAGEEAPPFISDKYSDSFINMPIFRAFARRKATIKRRSMQRNTACPFSGDNIVIPWRAYNRRKGQNDSHAPSGRRVDGTSRIGDRLLLLKQNQLDCLPDFTLPFAALG